MGCTKKEDICDKAVKIACTTKDKQTCNQTKKFAEAARQNESVYAKAIALKVCNDIVTMNEAMIELEKAHKVLDPIMERNQKEAAERLKSWKYEGK
jgi:hypothetical protein